MFSLPIHIPKALLKNYSCGPDNEIDVPGPSIEYDRWPNIFDALGLINLSTADPLLLPRDLSTVVYNDVSKLSMINKSVEFFLPTSSLLFPRRTNFGADLNPIPTTNVLYFCGIGGTYLEKIYY